jgi:Fe-S oxidoreductase
MTEVNKLAARRAKAEVLSCGRTMAEQIESIRKYGNHGVSPVLRSAVLASHGIAKPKARAENCIIFGCYRPFNTPYLVRDCIRLLDMLSIDYTYLDQEYCCGAPLAMQASRDQIDNIMAAGKDFNRQNYDLAQKKGATKLAYCCSGCAHAARNTFVDTSDRHVYMPDLILDSLEKHNLKIPPTVMGYFEGCHTFVRSVYPAGSIDWDRYRRRLRDVDGLKIVDIPNNMCCQNSAEAIIEHAEKVNLDKILCSCSGCYASLMQPAKGKVRLISLPELLLQSLESNVSHLWGQ